MPRISGFRWPARAILAITLAVLFSLASTGLAFASVPIVQISANDPYTNTTTQHQTQVEPDTFAFGSTIVSAFQVGRFTDGGSSNVGWATNASGGASGSWTNGFLPGTTVFATPPGPYNRVSDPAVAYDAKHNAWIIVSLATPSVGISI